MSEEAFSEEDAQFDRQDRFNARREMINLMIELGVEPKPVRIETPRGVHKSEKLRAFVEQARNAEAQSNEPVMQIDRPPGTGKIGKLVEEARRRFPHLNKDK